MQLTLDAGLAAHPDLLRRWHRSPPSFLSSASLAEVSQNLDRHRRLHTVLPRVPEKVVVSRPQALYTYRPAGRPQPVPGLAAVAAVNRAGSSTSGNDEATTGAPAPY